MLFFSKLGQQLRTLQKGRGTPNKLPDIAIRIIFLDASFLSAARDYAYTTTYLCSLLLAYHVTIMCSIFFIVWVT
jgi:hypothetical protein